MIAGNNTAQYNYISYLVYRDPYGVLENILTIAWFLDKNLHDIEKV